MSIYLSPLAGAGWQFFDNNGIPLAGGLLYTYEAGTTTLFQTYTSYLGNVQNPNPIVLDSSGRVPNEIWLTYGYGYKFVLTTSSGVQIGTYDNIPSNVLPGSANDAFNISYEQGNTTTAGSFIVGQSYQIATVGTTNFVAIGAVANQVGIYFTATGVGSGSGTAYSSRTVQSRLQDIISIKDFGAKGDGTTNDTNAFIAASSYITAAGGGSIIIPPGTYIVGKQTFAGATGLGYAYEASNIFYCENCANPINVYMEGATIKFASGLNFGSFNPVTGAAITTTTPYTNNDSRAWLGMMFFFQGCTGGVKVSGGILDGNLANLNIGGYWGDTGYQLFAVGIYVGNGFVTANTYSGNVEISNMTIQNFAEDGLYIASDLNPMLLENIIVSGCARNNISWTGGQNLTMINVNSYNAGQGRIYSAPATCFDAEPEVTGYNYNLTAINCRFVNGLNSSFISATGTEGQFTFESCVFGGIIIPTKPFIRMNDCTVIGRIQAPYASTFNVWPPSLYCRNTIFSNLGSTYGVNYTSPASLGLIEFLGGNEFAVFDNCRFDANNSFFGVFNGTNAQFHNCYISQTGTATVNGSSISGTFFGQNVMYLTNGQWDFQGDVKASCIVYGETSISYSSPGTITGWGSVPSVPSVGVQTQLPNHNNNDYFYNPTSASWTLASPSNSVGSQLNFADGIGSSFVGSVPNSGLSTSFLGLGVNGSAKVLLDTSGNEFPVTDNTQSLGKSPNRWSVVYAGTGTINTSDANQKQQFATLTQAEQATAKAIKGLFKTFKFNDAVAKKGTNARTHIGISAQDVESAFSANGLDATKYALFCSDTWYVLNGKEVKEGTAGATQVTQLGVRYEELLAFVIASL